MYPFGPLGQGGGVEEQLRVEQRPFGAEGFASTVWDSSIVMSKYLERHSSQFAGKRCLELGAGCGLVGACVRLPPTPPPPAPQPTSWPQ